MEALNEALHLHVSTRDQMAEIARKGKIKLQPDDRLPVYLAKISELTGIEIRTPEDVLDYRNELQRKIDKFSEIFRKKEVENTDSGGIMGLFYACCSVLEQSPDYTKMTLSELATFRDAAEKRAKKLNDVRNGGDQ